MPSTFEEAVRRRAKANRIGDSSRTLVEFYPFTDVCPIDSSRCPLARTPLPYTSTDLPCKSNLLLSKKCLEFEVKKLVYEMFKTIGHQVQYKGIAMNIYQYQSSVTFIQGNPIRGYKVALGVVHKKYGAFGHSQMLGEVLKHAGLDKIIDVGDFGGKSFEANDSMIENMRQYFQLLKDHEQEISKASKHVYKCIECNKFSIDTLDISDDDVVVLCDDCQHDIIAGYIKKKKAIIIREINRYKQELNKVK